MATFRDDALAEYNWWVADQAAQEAAKITDLQTRARQALIPVMTDHTGKLALDPMSKTNINVTDMEDKLVVLTTNDGSNVSFAVYPDNGARVFMSKLVDGEWIMGNKVIDMDDVGRELNGGW